MNDQIKQKLIEDIDNNVAGLTNIQIMQIADIINSQPPADPWIPVSERLPKQHERVLVTATVMQTAFLKEPKVAVDVGYLIDEWEKAFILSAAGTRQYVKAWQPLPEAYKGE